MFTIVIGGSASGKSEYAEQHVLSLSGKRIYLATMMPWDEECVKRIEKHRQTRKGRGFETVEQYILPEEQNFPADGNVLLEDLGNLLANTCYAGTGDGEGDPSEADAEAAPGQSDPVGVILGGIGKIRERVRHLTVVTNEIGMDGGAYTEQTHLYMEQLGELNRKLAARADRVVEVVCGIPVILKGDSET